MTVKIYKSYGVLAHEKQPFYSWMAPASEIYDLATVEIPETIYRGENISGNHLIMLGGCLYTLQEVLTNAGDAPALRWYDGHRFLEIVLREVTE